MFGWCWLHEVNGFAVCQLNDGLFPGGGFAEIGTTLAFLLTGVVAGIHGHHLLTEEFLNCFFDLQLVGTPVDLEDVFVVDLTEEGRLLGELDGLDDLEDVFHCSFWLGGAAGENLKRTVGNYDFVEVEDLLDVDLLSRHEQRGGMVE